MPSMNRGDWVGFTFNGIHSSELGFIRVSDGNRYNETVLPTMKDTTVQVPGENGTYYFGSYYTQKPFNFNIAFDSMTEAQFRKFRQVFSDKQIHDLILDEAPYKVYSVKVSAPPQLKYICFDENGQRIYKGEGTISLIAYYPFARGRWAPGEQIVSREGVLRIISIYFVCELDDGSQTILSTGKYLVQDIGVVYYDAESHTIEVMPGSYLFQNGIFNTNALLNNKINLVHQGDSDFAKSLDGKTIYSLKEDMSYIEASNCLEWIEAYPTFLTNDESVNGLQGTIAEYTDIDKKEVVISANTYNLGDIETNFSININTEDLAFLRLSLSSEKNPEVAKTLELQINSNITNIKIDTSKRLVTEIINNNEIVRNNWIVSGDFFKIPQNINDIKMEIYAVYNGNLETPSFEWQINYNYLYY